MGTFIVAGNDANTASQLAEQASIFQGYGVGQGGTTSSTFIGPSRLSARTNKDAANSSLGRTLPAIIGTGRVEGLYFIGGMTSVDTTTSTTTTTVEPPTGTVVSVGHDPNNASNIAFLASLNAKRTTSTQTTTTTQSTTKCGYILAYDYFELGYDLVRLEIDGQVVFDSESQVIDYVGPEFRFYGGRQTDVDPIVDEIVGSLPGAYENMVMIFIDGFQAESPPSISAVISNATDTAETTADIIPGDYAEHGEFDWDYIAAYDPVDGLIYQVTFSFNTGEHSYIHVLSVDNLTELYKSPWPLSDDEWAFDENIAAFPGIPYLLFSYYDVDTFDDSRWGIVDAQTGTLVTSGSSEISGQIDPVDWLLTMNISAAFPGKYMAVGDYDTVQPDPGVIPDALVLVFDAATETAETFPLFKTIDYWTLACNGPVTSSDASFLAIRWGDSNQQLKNRTVMKITYDGSAVTAADLFSWADAMYATGIAYDPLTNRIAIPRQNLAAYNAGNQDAVGSAYDLVFYDATTYELLHTVTLTKRMAQGLRSPGYRTSNKFFPKPGTAFFYHPYYGNIGSSDLQPVYVIDMATYTVGTYTQNLENLADPPELTVLDGRRNLYAVINYPTEYPIWGAWEVHRAIAAAPRLITLIEAIQMTMSLPGFSNADLTFSGFTGLYTYGFALNADTTIQNAIKTLGDIYDFYWCDTGYGFYFKKPQTDGDYSLDVVLSADDIIEHSDPVDSSDDGDIRTPSSMELEYMSKEGNYNSRPTSFSMTAGTLNSITTPRYSTPILFDDAEAQRIITEKFFQAQQNRRGHAITVTPDGMIILPGDVISIPSGEVTYVAVVDTIAMDLRTMGVEITALDFATEVTTTITTVSNDQGTIVFALFSSIYLHLDIPLLAFSHDTNGSGLVQYGMLAPRLSTWTGAGAYRGTTESNTALIFDQAVHTNIVAIAQDALGAPADPFATTDTSTVTIVIVAGDADLLVDATEDAVLENGANLALIGANGRWELVGFTTAVDNGDNTWTLSGFVRRGYRGSEPWASTHAAGDYFIYPLSAVKHVVHQIADLDDRFFYKAVGFGQDVADVIGYQHTIPGVAETPYAVRNITFSDGGSPGGVQIFWDYRSRVADGLNPTDHGEASLAFEVDIYNASGTVYKRTLTTAINSVEYSDAQITSDFGGYPTQIFVDIFMMSATPVLVPGQTRVGAGRGYKASAQLTFGASLAASPGSYAITGTAATLRKGNLRINAVAGSYFRFGSVAALKRGRKIAALTGSYSMTGTAATLTKFP